MSRFHAFSFFFCLLSICLVVSCKSRSKSATSDTDIDDLLWNGDYADTDLSYVSTSSVHYLNADLTRTYPPVRNDKVPLTPIHKEAWYYLLPDSCLGYYGPLGPFGPLAALGPLGHNPWNLSNYETEIKDWYGWAKNVVEFTGPMSELGPLSENGPVGPSYYEGEVFRLNDFAVHTRAFGVWGALGPLGPLGALGPLGPLGPLGFHTDYSRDRATGQFKNDHTGKIVRSKKVPYFDGHHRVMRDYDLYEFYEQDFALKAKDLDTSWMVEARLPQAAVGAIFPDQYSQEIGVWKDLFRNASQDYVHSYTFTSKYDQIVTLVVTPVGLGSNFDLAVTEVDNTPVASSTTNFYVDWIQIKVPAGKTLKAQVWRKAPFNPLQPFVNDYRLYVTGSTQYLNKTNIKGPHIVQWKRDLPNFNIDEPTFKNQILELKLKGVHHDNGNEGSPTNASAQPTPSARPTSTPTRPSPSPTEDPFDNW